MKQKNCYLNIISDINQGRPNLGLEVPVDIYRALQFSIRDVLAEKFDSEFANKILYEAGKMAGQKFGEIYLDVSLGLNDFISQLSRIFVEKKLGVLRIEKIDPDAHEYIFTVAEDLNCSGLPFIDSVACSYDEGFFAGIFKYYWGLDFSVNEIDCWGTGHRVCRFQIKYKD